MEMRSKTAARISKISDRRATEMPANAMVCMVEVDDPFELGGRILGLASVRDDPLRAMWARGQIAEHQLAAARAWQRLWEQAEVGGIRAIDTSRIQVDGAAPSPELVTLRRRYAIRQLGRVRKRLGDAGNGLVVAVLARGWTLRLVAQACGLSARPGSRDLLYLGHRLRECLDTMALELGLA